MGFYRVLSPDELMHHGILGMKWGKKNGPPYPLSSSAHSSSEKKAGWRKSLDGGSKEKNAFSAKATAHKVAAKIYGVNERVYSKSNKTLSSINKTEKNRQLKKAQEAQAAANARKSTKQELKRLNGEKGLSDRQKKILKVGAVVAGTALAAYGAYRLSEYLGDKNFEKNMKAANEFLSKVEKRFSRESGYLVGLGPEGHELARKNEKQFADLVEKTFGGVSRKGKFNPNKIDPSLTIPKETLEKYWDKNKNWR